MIPDENWDTLLKAIRTGLSNKDACVYAGIKENTFYVKKKNDPEFAAKVEHALVFFKTKHIQKIANDGSWQSSAWLLERKFKSEFGKNLDITSGGEPLGPRVDYNRLSPSELKILLELERKATIPEEEYEDAEIVEETKLLE